jgi:hypothetical protein
MSAVRPFLVLSILAFLLVWAPAASAERGCQAPPGTAAVDQYCDNLPSADGTTDPSEEGVERLAAVLPKPVADRLRNKGLLGEVLLALPAVPAREGPRTMTARRRRFEPRVDALLPGPAANARSVARAATSTGGANAQMGWVLGLTLFCVSALSLRSALRRD